jgi:VanZ family protein
MFRLARLAGFVGVAAIVVLSCVPGQFRPDTGFGKTLEHAFAYVVVSALLTATTRARWPQAMALMLIVLSAALEVSQAWIPGRTPMLSDLFASSAGALLGAGLASLIHSRLVPDRG